MSLLLDRWILLGYRITSLCEEWATRASKTGRFFSVSESVADMYPDHEMWYAQYFDAVTDWCHAPPECRILGAAYHEACSGLVADRWIPPSGVYWSPRASATIPISPKPRVIGYEAVALGYGTVFSWRYFGGEDVREFARQSSASFNEHGLIRSHGEAMTFSAQMEEFTKYEGEEWLPLMIFETEFTPIAW
ncbi:hypothetical protein L0U85_12060 [Glycomyces sp. L485]|uniref:hypothetical protein n=1 Tax=Glycomyces sp. L485 TaxID=2909235 RepID=UPI001F4A24FF|nr:hypothetical protein [Glycomyces sp. L485]MCH7231578.1 hypothetical protein [Glycomyces sp. L485]